MPQAVTTNPWEDEPAKAVIITRDPWEDEAPAVSQTKAVAVAGKPSGLNWADEAVGFLRGLAVNTPKAIYHTAKRVLAGPQTPEEQAVATAMGPGGLAFGPLVMDIAKSHVDTFEKGLEQGATGGVKGTAKAAGYGAASAIPIVGPLAAYLLEKGTGSAGLKAKPGEAAGEAVGAVLAPKIIPPVARATVRGARAAGATVANVAETPGLIPALYGTAKLIGAGKAVAAGQPAIGSALLAWSLANFARAVKARQAAKTAPEIARAKAVEAEMASRIEQDSLADAARLEARDAAAAEAAKAEAARGAMVAKANEAAIAEQSTLDAAKLTERTKLKAALDAANELADAQATGADVTRLQELTARRALTAKAAEDAAAEASALDAARLAEKAKNQAAVEATTQDAIAEKSAADAARLRRGPTSAEPPPTAPAPAPTPTPAAAPAVPARVPKPLPIRDPKTGRMMSGAQVEGVSKREAYLARKAEETGDFRRLDQEFETGNPYMTAARATKVRDIANSLLADGLTVDQVGKFKPKDWEAAARKVGRKSISQTTIDDVLTRMREATSEAPVTDLPPASLSAGTSVVMDPATGKWKKVIVNQGKTLEDLLKESIANAKARKGK